MCSLTQKYNVAGPRYTSYPTVPYWDIENFSGKRWKESVVKTYDEQREQGISLYIHLPFCESMCTFCGCHKRITKRHELETPYVHALLREWRLYRELLDDTPIVREIHLGGGTPTFFSPENLQILIKGILRYAKPASNATFSFEGHPNNTTKTHLQTLYDLGFTKVCFGVQDYNEAVQKAIHRVQPFENVKRVTQYARDIGYTSVGHDIIYGLPFQTTADVENTIAKTSELRPDRIAYYSYAHVPWKKGNGQRGYKEENLPKATEKMLMADRGKQLLTEIGYKHIGMDHFALPTDDLFKALIDNSLHRNFMGYTASKTHLLIGLGVSSISDSGYGLAQNVKSIEEYQHLVENNILPVYRGHLLNGEDLIVRQQILNLMCNFKTSWNAKDNEILGVPLIFKQLSEPARDGLVKTSEHSIEVTEKGKAFIRNICMALDMRLHRRLPDQQLFSMTV